LSNKVKVLNPAQEEQLKEIGAHLREVRLQQSLSIDEIAAKTLIRVTFLQALEEGQLDLLPEAIFVQGFIRRYGDVLGLDGTALGKTFPTDFSLPESDMDTKTQSRGISIPLYIPYIFLLIAATCGLSYLLNSQRGTQFQQPVASQPIPKSQPPLALAPKPLTKPATVVIPTTQAIPASTPVAIPTPLTQATPASTPVAIPTPLTQATPKPNSPIKVTVNLQDSSWVRVTVDGKKEFEGILPKEKQQTWTASKSLTFRTGNAGAVMLSLNEQEAKLLGSVGAVKEITFTPENTAPQVSQSTPLPISR
jgi:cytoskeletal protein RodZ